MYLNAKGLEIIEKYPSSQLVTPIETAEDIIDTYIERVLLSNQYSALVSFVSTTNENTFLSSPVPMLINKGLFIQACEHLETFVSLNGKISRSLIKRRREEMALFLKPEIVGGKDGLSKVG